MKLNLLLNGYSWKYVNLRYFRRAFIKSGRNSQIFMVLIAFEIWVVSRVAGRMQLDQIRGNKCNRRKRLKINQKLFTSEVIAITLFKLKKKLEDIFGTLKLSFLILIFNFSSFLKKFLS